MWRALGLEMQENLVSVVNVPEGDQLRRNVTPAVLADPDLDRAPVRATNLTFSRPVSLAPREAVASRMIEIPCSVALAA
jgi:hypothetical protein